MKKKYYKVFDDYGKNRYWELITTYGNKNKFDEFISRHGKEVFLSANHDSVGIELVIKIDELEINITDYSKWKKIKKL